MKAAVYYGARDIRVEEIENPEIGVNDILLRVKACGICGSDVSRYVKGIWARPGWVLGHELCGEVTEIGRNVKHIKKGDRIIPDVRRRIKPSGCGKCFWCKRDLPEWCEVLVPQPCGSCKYCITGRSHLCLELKPPIGFGRNGGYAEYCRISNAELNQNVEKLPDKLDFKEGALVELVEGALQWVSLADPQPEEVVVVMGAGPIGLCVAQVIKNLGSKVIVCEISEKRLALAKELGADVIINPEKEDAVQRVLEITGKGRSYGGREGARADLVMECSGAPMALQQALEMLRTGGRIVLVGVFGKSTVVDPNKINFKALRVISSFLRGAGQQEGFKSALELVTTGKVRVGHLITHEFPLDRISEAFETQLRSDESIKVLVTP
jgi:2-desacetyl-2-hydroxyethyl bacteriochlorophyllide A dehydrogenase